MAGSVKVARSTFVSEGGVSLTGHTDAEPIESAPCPDECDIVLDEPPSFREELRSLGKLSWPIAVSILSRLLMLTVDVACLGHIGVEELASASMAAVWCQVVTSFMSGPAFILNTLCAQAWGAKNFPLVGVWLQMSILTITLLTPLGIVALLFTGPVMGLFGASARVRELASEFARLSTFWVWPNLIYVAVRQYFQAQDNVMPAMIVNVCFVFVNLLLNLILIWGIPGVVPGLGFVGSPIATSISRWLQLIVFLVYVWSRGLHAQTWMGWQWKEVLNRTRMCEFLSQAFPLMFINVLGSSWDQLTTLISAYLGVKALAEQSGMGTLLGPLFSVPAGIGFAIQLRVGQHLGAQRPLCAKHTWKCAFALMIAVCAVIGTLFLCLAPVIGRIFSDDRSVVATSTQLTPVLCLIFLLGSMGQVNFAALEGQARQKVAIVVAILGHGVTTVPFTLLFCFLLHWGLFGIWWGQVLGEVLCVVLTVLVVSRSDWTKLSADAVRRSATTEPVPSPSTGDQASMSNPC